jgi:hypothetical protein
MATIGHEVDGVAEAPAALLRMIQGFQVSQMICVAAKLGIADLLVDGAKSSADLASTTGTHAPSLYRLLRALAGMGIFAEDEQGRFGLTPLAEPLRKDVPSSLRAAALFSCDPVIQQIWGELQHSVTTGEDGFNYRYGMGAWAFREQNPELNASFNEFMTALTRLDTDAIVADYDFSSMDTLVDVGGGQGTLVAAIVKATPGLHGIVFDQAHVVDGAAAVLAAAGVADRCEVVGGDFFSEVPQGKDGYILKNIIHDWDDARSIMILKTCRRAILATGKLLLFEFVIPPGNSPHPGKQLDINMLVGPGGQERTEQEYRTLLMQGGFQLARVVPTKSEKGVIEAVPV